jgi:hypothetical protein
VEEKDLADQSSEVRKDPTDQRSVVKKDPRDPGKDLRRGDK